MRVTNRQTPALIHDEQQFLANSMSATTSINGTGFLPHPWRDRFYADKPRYVVYSYATPIAWVAEDGTVVVPDVKYSVTTSKHQGFVRQGFRNRVDVMRLDQKGTHA